MYIVFPYQSVVDLYNLALSSIPGVNLSLLSRVMSSRLSRGTYNGGLLSTEAGTLARVVADATITLAGYVHQSMLLNVTLLPSLFICVTSILATCFTYNSLYWFVWGWDWDEKRRMLFSKTSVSSPLGSVFFPTFNIFYHWSFQWLHIVGKVARLNM